MLTLALSFASNAHKVSFSHDLHQNDEIKGQFSMEQQVTEPDLENFLKAYLSWRDLLGKHSAVFEKLKVNQRL